MFTRKPKSVPGLDFSGPCKVLPPTFAGVKKLVERVGFDVAAASCAVSDPDFDAPHDLVREFLSDITLMDAVERQTAIRDFSEYVSDLEKSSSLHSAAGVAANAKDEAERSEAASDKELDTAAAAESSVE